MLEMQTDCTMNEFVALSVLRIVTLPLIVVSTEACVPPKVTVFGFAVPDDTPPPACQYPQPVTLLFAPAAPTDCTSKSNARYQAVIAIVTVPCVRLTPIVVPAGPHCGVIIAVPPVSDTVPK